MELGVTGTKILIIFGLLFATLFAALLPLLCMKQAVRRERSNLLGQRRRRKSSNAWSPSRLLRCFKCGGGEPRYEDAPKAAGGPKNQLVRRISQLKPSKRQSKRALAMLNCFSGGIFLATSLVGLLPEVRESFDSFNITWPTRQGNGTQPQEELGLMPIAELITACGLFLILSIEQGAHTFNAWRQKRKAARHDDDSLSMQVIVGNSEPHAHKHDASEHAHKHDDVHNGASSTPQHQHRLNRMQSDVTSVAPSTAAGHDDVGDDHHAIRSLMLVATLSIHSLLEGVAIGLQEKAGSVVAIFVAVVFHKSLMAFSMGANLMRAKQTTRKVVGAALIFAFMSPVGISIGLGVKTQGGDDDGTVLFSAVLQAIACGTFMYITFFEVLVREFDKPQDSVAKVISLVVGFGAVVGTFFAQHW